MQLSFSEETLKTGRKEAGSMASYFQVVNHADTLAPALESQKARYSKIYNQHCHRIYSLAFWMTDNELVAEQLSAKTFQRAFAVSRCPSTEQIDQAFLAEVIELTPLEAPRLTAVTSEIRSIYCNVKRVHLERAVVQLPATEKLIFLLHDVEGYEHVKIGRLLGIGQHESRIGLHQARLRIRELVGRMQ